MSLIDCVSKLVGSGLIRTAEKKEEKKDDKRLSYCGHRFITAVTSFKFNLSVEESSTFPSQILVEY